MEQEYIEQRDVAARLQDSDITARIVRNIAEIERDYHFASGPLSDKLMQEIIQTIVKGSTAPWLVDDSEDSALLTFPEWKAKGLGHSDLWIELGEICDEDLEYSWVAAAVHAGGTQLCFEVLFRKGLASTAAGVIRNDKVVAPLLKLGFVRHETEPRLFMPIRINGEALAVGFELNDLAEALLPVKKAVDVLTAAKPELDKLIGKIRTDAGIK